jgi:6-phosphogluconolactonase (cycloisomerase 2 family)
LWLASLGIGGAVATRQVSQVPAPSFVARHPSLPRVYAVSEAKPSLLTIYDSAAPGEALESMDIGGDGACHVLVASDGRALHVALYESGELVSMALDAAGTPRADTLRRHAYVGSGPRADRQESAHAHFVAFAPGNRHLLVVDLGSDTVWAHPLDDAGLPEPPHIALRTPPGSGPRHLAIRGELLYVVCELDHMLRVARWERSSASATLLTEQPVTLVGRRTGEDLFDAHVEIVAAPSGDVLLSSVRGADVISVFDIAPEGELRYRAAFDAGHWPRHFAVTADAGITGRVVVAAARGHEIRSYALEDVLALEPEGENGAVAELPFASARVVSPACICPA